MMKTIKDKLELALEALITINNTIYVNSQQEAAAVYKANDAITALKEALTSVPDWASEAIEQPSQLGWTDKMTIDVPDQDLYKAKPAPVQQDPVAVADGTFNHNCPVGTPLYTSPPVEASPLAQRQRSVKPLTDEEIDAIADEYLVDYRIPAGCALNFARDIEAAHGIKENT